MTLSQTASNEAKNQLPTVSELLSIEIAAHSNTKATLQALSRRYNSIDNQLRSQQEATCRWYNACGSATRSFQQSSDMVTSLREENHVLKCRLGMVEEELQIMRSKNDEILQTNVQFLQTIDNHVRLQKCVMQPNDGQQKQ